MPTVFLSIRSKSFSAADTLTSGQCFRWTQRGGRLCGTAFGRYVEIEQQDDGIRIFGADGGQDESLWRQYLDLDRDYDEIRRTVTGIEPRLNDSAQYASGVHILAQEPWEALCSFVISQNNNIPRITNIISRLCNLFGDKPYGVSSFPRPEIISSLNIHDLSHIKAGFRAKYILDAAKCIVSSRISLDIVKSMKTNDAIKYLQTIYGVGPKVASCTLLYGYHKLDCFPIDTWMRKVLSKFFQNFDYRNFKEYQGLAQLYLFNWSRSHPEYFQ